MMDIIRAVYRARPDVKWKKNSVNGFDINTIRNAYIGDDFPDDSELNAAWLFCLKSEKKEQAKKTAYKKIIDILPEWKQRNCIAKSVELTEKKVDGIILTQDETDLLNSIKSSWALIQEIRTASDNIETALDDIVVIEDIENYDILNSILWP